MSRMRGKSAVPRRAENLPSELSNIGATPLLWSGRERCPRHLPRQVGNGKHSDLAERNAFRALDQWKFPHADAKWLHGDRVVGHGVLHLGHSVELEMPVLVLNLQLSQMTAQFHDGIAVDRDGRKMPKVGSERRNIILGPFGVSLVGRR